MVKGESYLKTLFCPQMDAVTSVYAYMRCTNTELMANQHKEFFHTINIAQEITWLVPRP